MWAAPSTFVKTPRVSAVAGCWSLCSAAADRQSCKLKVLGSIPSGGCAGAPDNTPNQASHVLDVRVRRQYVWRASLARLAKHALRKRMVMGSIPTRGACPLGGAPSQQRVPCSAPGQNVCVLGMRNCETRMEIHLDRVEQATFSVRGCPHSH